MVLKDTRSFRIVLEHRTLRIDCTQEIWMYQRKTLPARRWMNVKYEDHLEIKQTINWYTKNSFFLSARCTVKIYDFSSALLMLLWLLDVISNILQQNWCIVNCNLRSVYTFQLLCCYSVKWFQPVIGENAKKKLAKISQMLLATSEHDSSQ